MYFGGSSGGQLVQSLLKKGSARQGCPAEILITPRMEFPPLLWVPVPVSDHPFSLCLTRIFCVPTWPWCLSSFHCASMRRVCLLYTPPLNRCILQYITWPIFSLGLTNPTLSACSHMSSVPVPGPSWLSCAGLAPGCQCLSCTVDPQTAQCSRCGLTNSKQRWRITLLDLLVALPLVQDVVDLQGPIAGSCWTCPPGPKDLFQQSYSPTSHSPSSKSMQWPVPSQVHVFAFDFVELGKIPQPIEVLLNCSPALQCILLFFPVWCHLQNCWECFLS